MATRQASSALPPDRSAIAIGCLTSDHSALGAAVQNLERRGLCEVRWLAPPLSVASMDGLDAVLAESELVLPSECPATGAHGAAAPPLLVHGNQRYPALAIALPALALNDSHRLWRCIGEAISARTRARIGHGLESLIARHHLFHAILDFRGRLLHVNAAGETLLGGRPWWGTELADWIARDCVDTVRRSAYAALPRDGHWVANTRLTCDGDTETPVELNLTVLDCGPASRQLVLATVRPLEPEEAGNAQLLEQAERFRRLVELSPDAMFIETQGRIIYANRAAVRLVGAKTDSELIDRMAGRFIHRSSWDRATDRADRVAAGETVNMSREWVRRLDGSTVQTEITAAPIMWRGHTATLGLVRDISDRERAMLALEDAERRLTDILGSIDNVIWSASVADSTLLYVNPAAEALYGRSVSELLGNNELWRKAVHPEDRHVVRGSLRQLRREGSVTREFRIVRADGSIRWVEDRVRLAYDHQGRPVRIDGVSMDITQRKEHEEHIKYLANYDELTGLPNRNLFADRLSQWLPHARRTGQTLAVMFVGIDRLKHINDSFGHGVGDKLIYAVAQRLRALVREGDSLARFAGDEFILLLPQLSGPEAAATMARRILRVLGEPLAVDGMELHVTASIGISLFPNDGEDIETLTQHADTAMFRAKTHGGDTLQFYTDEMSRNALHRAELESALRRAQQSGQLELHYQPQIDLNTGNAVGVEALLRWRHPTLGMVPPDQFIPIAEETGLILPIGAEVLLRACTQMREWQHQGLRGCRVSVNLSARQFMDPKLLERLERALDESGLEPALLDIELTESTVLQDEPSVTESLQAMKRLGVSISMDDFGTGYSSLSYLKRFPIDRVKIDKSFIRDIHVDEDDAVIANAIITLGHSLGLRVVGEGVETEAQLERLVESGCDEVQGFLYSPALPPAECIGLLLGGNLGPARRGGTHTG